MLGVRCENLGLEGGIAAEFVIFALSGVSGTLKIGFVRCFCGCVCVEPTEKREKRLRLTQVPAL